MKVIAITLTPNLNRRSVMLEVSDELLEQFKSIFEAGAKELNTRVEWHQ